jgi:hypothetical protein
MNFKIIVSKERNFKLIIVKILGAILKNLVAQATWLPGFVEPCGAISQKTLILYMTLVCTCLCIKHPLFVHQNLQFILHLVSDFDLFK